MDVEKMIRDPSLYTDVIKKVDGTLIAKQDIIIQIPFRYIPAKLAEIGRDIYTVAIFALICGDKYTVSNICSSIELTPSSISSETINGEEYYNLIFSAGEVVSPRTALVVDDNFSYHTFDEFIGKAKVPWFLTYEDVGKCIAYSNYYAGIDVAPNNAVIELLVAGIARDQDNIKVVYRNTINSIDEQYTRPPVLLPFRSIIDGTTNTLGKLIGSYFNEGIVSALTEKGGPSGVEDLFRL